MRRIYNFPVVGRNANGTFGLPESGLELPGRYSLFLSRGCSCLLSILMTYSNFPWQGITLRPRFSSPPRPLADFGGLWRTWRTLLSWRILLADLADLADFGLADFGRLRRTLADFGRLWRTLADFGWLRQVCAVSDQEKRAAHGYAQGSQQSVVSYVFFLATRG